MTKSHTRQRGETRSLHPSRVDDRNAKTAELPKPPGGELIGRRIGRSTKQLGSVLKHPEKQHADHPVDTSEPGIAADDKKAGGGSTARRNALLDPTHASYSLEDSATGKPSRKSTRRSINHIKPDSQLQRRETRRTTSPDATAMRAAVKSQRVRGGGSGARGR